MMSENQKLNDMCMSRNKMKKCIKCSNEKESKDFYKSKTTKDGLDCYCKECKKVICRSNRDEWIKGKLYVSTFLDPKVDKDIIEYLQNSSQPMSYVARKLMKAQIKK